MGADVVDSKAVVFGTATKGGVRQAYGLCGVAVVSDEYGGKAVDVCRTRGIRRIDREGVSDVDHGRVVVWNIRDSYGVSLGEVEVGSECRCSVSGGVWAYDGHGGGIIRVWLYPVPGLRENRGE